MEDVEWIHVINQRKQKRQIRQNTIEETKKRWKTLKRDCPHIILPSRAQRIRRKINITHLDKKLVSDEWIEYQCQGWHYVKVIKHEYLSGIPKDTETVSYSVLPIDNGWGDVVLFSRSLPNLIVEGKL